MRAIDFSASVVACPRGIDGLLLCVLGGFPCVRAIDFGCASLAAWPRGIDDLQAMLAGLCACLKIACLTVFFLHCVCFFFCVFVFVTCFV